MVVRIRINCCGCVDNRFRGSVWPTHTDERWPRWLLIYTKVPRHSNTPGESRWVFFKLWLFSPDPYWNRIFSFEELNDLISVKLLWKKWQNASQIPSERKLFHQNCFTENKYLKWKIPFCFLMNIIKVICTPFFNIHKNNHRDNLERESSSQARHFYISFIASFSKRVQLLQP